MTLKLLHVGAIATIAWMLFGGLSDDGREVGEIPTTCRECDENERTYNTFRCPECHSEMTPDDHPPLATEYEENNA